MNCDSLPLYVHYPPVSQKPNTYNQLQAATGPARPRGVPLPFAHAWFRTDPAPVQSGCH